MSNKKEINQIIINDHIDTLNETIKKMSYLSDSIKAWDNDTLDMSDNNKYGFSLLMENVISEINNSISTLEK